MVEMRWYNGVLQYRQLEDKTNYANITTNALSKEAFMNGHRNMQWGDWVHVPSVLEILHGNS